MQEEAESILSATSVTSDTARLIVSADSEFNSAICWFLEEFSAKHSINELRVRCSGWIVVRFVIGLVSSKIPLNKAVKLLSTRVCASRASECLSIAIYIIWQNQLKILTILLNKCYNLKDIGLKSASLSYTYYENAIKKAIILSKDKNIVIGSCINPTDIEKINMPNEIDSYINILITCYNESLKKKIESKR